MPNDGTALTIDEHKAAMAATLDTFVGIRRDFHKHPELAFEETRTSEIVGNLLDSWGYDVARHVGGTGLVATLSRGTGDRSLAIRADMDALPIVESSDAPYASATPGLMHACGHDGHTAILLCAARHLAEAGRFDGTLRLVFQPAEENGAGARRMLGDRLFDRFPTDAIFGLHNLPGLQAGRFGFIAGPAMASSDSGIVTITGKGGHGAVPHKTIDPVLASAAFILALQSIVSRSVNPNDTAVATVGSIHGGSAGSIIPDQVEMKFTLRAFKEEVRATLLRRIEEIAHAQAGSFGATADVKVLLSVAPLYNHPAETEFARKVAIDHFGDTAVATLEPFTGGEDFAYFLKEKPGSFVHVGNGDSASLHSPRYDFNDAVIAPAALYWVKLTETYLAATR